MKKNETEEKKSFPLGKLVYSKGVDLLRMQDKKFRHFVRDSLEQYKACDWGFTGPEGKAINDRAIETGQECILGEYRHPDHPEWTIWFLTESDRSMTTAIFPEECAYSWEGF